MGHAELTMELGASAARVQDETRRLALDIAVREMPASTRTAEEAAAACDVTVGQIVKSLVLRSCDILSFSFPSPSGEGRRTDLGFTRDQQY